MKASNPLEDLKNTWKGLSNEKLKKEVSTEDIKKLIRKKSISELIKVRRKLSIEAILNIIAVPFFIIWIHSKMDNHAYIFDLLILIAVVVYFLPIIGFYKIGKIKYQETKKYLSNFIIKLKRFIKFQIIAGTIAFPVAIIVGILLAELKSSNDKLNLLNIGKTNFENIALLIGISTILLTITLIAMLIIRAYYRKLYMKHVISLSQYLYELQSHEKEIKSENE